MLDRRRLRSERTRQAILSAARQALGAGQITPTMGAVAAGAGVSRLTVYQHFGSHQGLLAAVASQARPDVSGTGSGGSLESAIHDACERWAGDPVLFRRLPAAAASNPEPARRLAERLASEDRLRPGCSIREAEDVIGVVTSFDAFDRLHRDGRRSTTPVAEILHRMAASILNRPAYD